MLVVIVRSLYTSDSGNCGEVLVIIEGVNVRNTGYDLGQGLLLLVIDDPASFGLCTYI